MTTICYRGGVLAADTRAYSGDKHPIGAKAKIRRLDDGTLIGCSTTVVGGGERVLDWYAAGMPEDQEVPEHFQLIVAKPGGELFYANGNAFLSGPLEAGFIAIGSGEQYAHGALMAGACAVEACKIACACDPWTGFPIMAIRHGRKTPWKIER